MSKKLLSGNEAIARGAYEAGVKTAYGYPGTPSTEILEELAKYDDVYAEWCPNEKVAFEVGIGSSIAGARTFVAMKQVGLNVAADPLFTFSYTGVNAGFVFVSADDPQLHSSQNEQDNRHYAKAAKVPMIEPSDSQEAKDMVIEAFKISEEFDTPVMMRTTTRIAHSKSMVENGERAAIENKKYEKNPQKFVMIPAHGIKRHAFIEERLKRLQAYAEGFKFNTLEMNSNILGIVSSGITYQYAKELFPEASHLKLAFTHPLPVKLIKKFADKVKNIMVVEELDPFLEDALRTLGLKVTGKEFVPIVGELNPGIVYDAVIKAYPEAVKLAQPGIDDGLEQAAGIRKGFASIPMRPPALCPGCPHRGVFYALRKHKYIVNGDIGCYTLAVLPPLSALDTQLDMGTGASVVHGFTKADAAFSKKAVGVIGDSTFIHSGIAPLINTVYNKGTSTVIILDNRITAMTGRQDHPGTGRTIKGEKTYALDFEKLARAIGIKSVRTVDPYDLKETEKAINEETAKKEPSLIIARRACLLIERVWDLPYEIVTDVCRDCGQCISLGCPALTRSGDVLKIDRTLCIGCGVCYKICKFDAVKTRSKK